MLKKASILGVSLFAIILSWTSILSSITDTEASSLEVRLAEGDDPTDILEATASGGEIKPLKCDQVVFGKAKDNLFIRELGSNLYVSDVNGFKAFKLETSAYYANQVSFDASAQRLQKTFDKCNEPKSLTSFDITFLTN